MWRSIPNEDGLRELEEFTSRTKDKLEYIRGRALLLRARGRKGDEVASELGVSRASVYEWESVYAKSGIDGLSRKYSNGRPPKKKTKAKKIIPELMKKDPKLFGFLKGRWVVRDIATEIEKETGIKISKSHVERILDELDLSYKRPKLHVKSDDPNYYRKKREVRNYKRIASALAKKGVLVAFQDETWESLYPKIEAEWMRKGEQKRVLTPKKNKRRNTFITLLWPERKNGLFFNIYPKRRSSEFRRHLSNVLQHAKRLGAKKIIMFVDHATCHKSPATKKFIRNHKSFLKVKLLAKRAPRLNPVEGDVNRPLKSVVCTNKSHPDIESVVEETTSFLRKYRQTLGT